MTITPMIYPSLSEALATWSGSDLLTIARREVDGVATDAPPTRWRWDAEWRCHYEVGQELLPEVGLPRIHFDPDGDERLKNEALFESERAADEDAYRDRLDIMEHGPGIVGVDIEAAPEPPAGMSHGDLLWAAIDGTRPLTQAELDYLIAFRAFCRDNDSDYWHAQADATLDRIIANAGASGKAPPQGDLTTDDFWGELF